MNNRNKNKSHPFPIAIITLLSLMLTTLTNALGIEDFVDGGNDYPWERVEIPGTQCSNSSQYKFWVYDAPKSNNLLIMFEGGGACWDYPSCSGATGILGAANPNGLADDYITTMKAEYVSPLVNGADPGFPTRPKNPIVTNGWDVVYMPYCTGDVHIGNSVVTYHDPLGAEPPILFRHKGFHNTTQAMSYLAGQFPNINKLLITGFSAGGVATSAGYYVARNTLQPNQGFMLNDSGPLFPAPNTSYHSRYLHETIRTAWNLDSVFSQLPDGFDPENFGSVNDLLAQQFPNDRLAYTAYSSDFNFSRFSYERFYPGIDKAGILEKWREDQANMIAQMDQHANYSYHVPWHRPINDSHCSSIVTFIGSHSCPSIRKKKWYEYIEWPWTQTWKCPGDLNPLETFLERWMNNGERLRFLEPSNNYNNEDPGMRIIAPLLNAAI
jgi:Pectinacetylesterase